ncbi:MAG: RNA polymerase sigma factor [Candidatus Dormibacteraeota bacterium]|nr:RNA polymerase sigma factor [Candidatus Dormibacteraeota bacterium]
MSTDRWLEELLRPLTPQVLGTLMRRWGQFDACEDAVQEALLAAAVQWPERGVPDNPHGWLVTVATRRLTDQIRSEAARRRREDRLAVADPTERQVAPAADEERPADRDDTLATLFLCCHPALSPPTQIALTLRAVGGLTTAEIAHAFLVPEATMAQRISRAKQRIRETGSRFTLPPLSEWDERLRAVLQVLYLIFNEGYTTTAGADLARGDLTGEAIRLARLVHRLLPEDGEVAGLLALMLLTEARRPARTRPDGSLVPLEEQDRGLWDQDLIREGVELVTDSLRRTRPGPYQLQAAIAAVHDEAARTEDTDWPQILSLYRLLEAMSPNPMVALNRAVAVAMVHGPQAGLAIVDQLATDSRMARHHRLHQVRAHLLERSGQAAEARDTYLVAARYANNVPERRYLESRAAGLASRAPLTATRGSHRRRPPDRGR